MGNAMTCMPGKDTRNGVVSRSKRVSKSQQRKSAAAEEELLHRQALALAIQQHQLSQRFEGSMSRRIGGSTSSRRHLNTDPLSNGKQQVPIVLDNVETKKLVLVHGEGFGAWCWYKTIAMLEEAGLNPVALDLTGSGIDNTDVNSINSLADYAKPLMNYLESLPVDEKVIVVGHSCGGASISYALEHYPKKISKAVFLSATMVSDGQKPFDIFAEEELSAILEQLRNPSIANFIETYVELDKVSSVNEELLASAEAFMKESQFLLYGNGRDKPPTGLMFNKQQLKGLYFNQSPPKDIALATVSMRPTPLGPIMEKLSLTQENYGSVRRYFIQTLDDRMLSPDVQEKLVRENPPHGVYKIKGSDHCPFFSKPQSLNKFLLEIVQIQ